MKRARGELPRRGRRAFALLTLATPASLAAIVACGGSVTSGSIASEAGAPDATIAGPDAEGWPYGDGGITSWPDAGNQKGDAGANGDAGGGGYDASLSDALCPAAPPNPGDPCPPHYPLECEYGTANDPLCNTTYSCNSKGWSVGYDGRGCNYVAPNDPTCPATYAIASEGGTCASPAVCEYPGGRCECIETCGGPPPPPDAGGPRWLCSSPPAGCPSPRGSAMLGAPCDTPGLSCAYQLCCGGANQTCSDAGIWEGTIYNSACP